MKHLIYHFTSILRGLIRTHKRPAHNVSGFIAQLVRASHRYARSRVQTPLKSWLFQASIRNCLNCVQNCDDHGLLEYISCDIFRTSHPSAEIYWLNNNYFFKWQNWCIIVNQINLDCGWIIDKKARANKCPSLLLLPGKDLPKVTTDSLLLNNNSFWNGKADVWL